MSGEHVGQCGEHRSVLDARDEILRDPHREAVAADADDAGRRAVNGERFGFAIDAAGIPGVDAAVGDLQFRCAAALGAGRKRRVWHHRAGERKCAPWRACNIEHVDAPRSATRQHEAAGRDRRRLAVRSTARSGQSDLAEYRDIHQGPARPERACCQPLGRTPDREHAGQIVRADQPGLSEPHDHGARQHRDRAAFVRALCFEYCGRERVMQRERAAGQQPRHHGRRKAGKRSKRERT